MKAQTQGDIVQQDQGFKAEEEVIPVTLPGIQQLHTRSTEEIAEVLAVVLKSQRNVIRMDWKIGESIELTVQNE